MFSSSLSSVVCRYFSLDEIKDATNNFDMNNVIGEGGEGIVYLGHIAVGGDKEKFPVAVKRLDPNSIEFEKEIKVFSKIQHPNLVSLLGYCNEFDQKILVYEYMQGGSLSDYVSNKMSICFSWTQWLRICLGAARGLQYLHTITDELPKGIIHRDIKPANILLDKNWVAKVSDFGMSKLSRPGQLTSLMSADLKGTCGYYAPEYVATYQITRKIDVYAFGVVLFEVLCGKNPWNRRGNESFYLADDDDLGVWAQENVDTEIYGEISDDSLKIFTDIIGRSLQQDPLNRPTINEVVLGLERALKFHELEDHEAVLRLETALECHEPEDYEGIRPQAPRICEGCNAEVGQGRFLNCMGGVWHPECFRCQACSLRISDYEFYSSENHPFHISCYKESHPTCYICKNFIPTRAAGISTHPFWPQEYCRLHERDMTPRCYSCKRIKPRDHTEYVILDDGRKLCPECLDSAIVNTHECQPLYLEIQEFFNGLNMKIEQEFPLLLVKIQELNEAIIGEKYLFRHQILEYEEGFRQAEEKQAVSAILRSPPWDVKFMTEPVSCIYILCSLPRLWTGSIIAYMMMHGWLWIKGKFNLPSDVEEGISLVLAHMWLDSEIQASSGSSVASTPSSSSSAAPTLAKKGNLSQFEKQLGEFYKYQIESDYRFEEGNKAVLKYGLETTLENILLTGTFPCE